MGDSAMLVFFSVGAGEALTAAMAATEVTAPARANTKEMRALCQLHFGEVIAK